MTYQQGEDKDRKNEQDRQETRCVRDSSYPGARFVVPKVLDVIFPQIAGKS